MTTILTNNDDTEKKGNQATAGLKGITVFFALENNCLKPKY